MEIDKLKKWKSSLEAEVLTMKNKIQSLNAELQRKGQQIELICKLIDSADGSISNPVAKIRESVAGSGASHFVTPGQVKDHVYEILAEAKRPMNINEIHAEFVRRGCAIPGKGTAFNILVHIGRELKLGRRARFFRAGRGMYSLRQNHPEKNV